MMAEMHEWLSGASDKEVGIGGELPVCTKEYEVSGMIKMFKMDCVNGYTSLRIY